MLKQHLNFVLLATIAGLLALPAQAAGSMSTNEMVMVLREAKVVSPATRLDVLKTDQEVTVITKKTPGMNERDCKIKAVLMAKALMDVQPKQLAAVKVIYTIDGENGDLRVVVGAGDVQSFAGGAITEDQLLKSLDLQKEGSDDSDGKAAVAEGPLKEKRMVLQSRIESLKEGGTGVAPFQKMFNDIEELARAGKTKETSQLMSDLSTKLSSQESFRDQAKAVAGGRGVKGQQGTASADAGGKQQFKPAGQSASSGPPTGSPLWLFQQRVQEIRDHFAEMEGKGISTSDFRARLKDLEGQSTKVSPQEAVQKIEDLKIRMMQAAGPTKGQGPGIFPAGGQWRGKFKGGN